MSLLLCSQCDKLFDTDDEVEAEFLPLPVCEDCVFEIADSEDETR